MDTDGDGYNDNTEVLAGTDLNCAAGENCSGFTELSDTEFFEDVLPNEVTSVPDTSLTDVQEAIESLTASEIRELLITAGADPEVVAEIADEELQALLLEVMEEVQASEDFQLLE